MATQPDIDRCWEAVKHASFPRIHTFIATSDLHMEYKLKKTPDEVLEATTEMVSYARSLCEDVEFSAEDATRSDPEFLYKVYSRAIAAGATTLNVPDTVSPITSLSDPSPKQQVLNCAWFTWRECRSDTQPQMSTAR